MEDLPWGPQLSRRRFLKLVGVATALAFAGCAAQGPQSPTTPTLQPTHPREAKYKWTCQAAVPQGNLFFKYGDSFCNLVKTATHGIVEINQVPAGTVVGVPEMLSAVSDGQLDACIAASCYFMGQVPQAAIFTSVNALFGPIDFIAWYVTGGGKELHSWMYQQAGFNVYAMGCLLCGMETFAWSHKPIKTWDDFKGLKFRTVPYWADILRQHGMPVTMLPAGEILPALSTKVLDATEFSTPAIDKTVGIQDIAKYFHYPGVHQPCVMFDFIVNKDRWDELPEELKQAIEVASLANLILTLTENEAANIEAIKFFIQHGNELVELEDEFVEQLTNWTFDYYDELANKDPVFAKLWNSITSFAKKWYSYKNLAYLKLEKAWAKRFGQRENLLL